MNRTIPRLATLVVMLGVSLDGSAVGLGSLRTSAVLGRPLDIPVPVRLEPGEELSSECVGADVSFGDVPVRPSLVRVRVEPSGTPGEQLIRVMTDQPVEEPVVTLAVNASCSTRLARTYTVFADPPPVQAAPQQQAVVPAAGARREPRPTAVSPPAPVAVPTAEAAAPPPPAARAERAAKPSGPAPARRAATPTVAPPDERPRTTRPAAAPTSRSARPRLQLDALDAELALPSLRLSDELSVPKAQTAEEREAAAAAWRAMNATPDERVQDNQRLQALERSLQEMRAESARTRESLDQLQAQLRRAEEARYANPLVYVLVLICVLLAAMLAWVLRRQSGPRMPWVPSALGPESHRAELHESQPKPARRGAPPPDAEITSPDAKLAVAATQATRRQQEAFDAAMASQRTVAIPRAPVVMPPPAPEEHAGSGKVSVEELIDLEQQAEFFVALGQDESAIELLRSHVSGHPDGSPLPYLKLLEIYQRRDERHPYEEIRAQFNERFNAYAPAWEEVLADGRSLEDYPTVISRLQSLWESPPRALEVLQASLLRRDTSAQTFDLPAYRELLMLYSVARDRVEGEPVDDSVDVLLPLGNEEEDFPHSMLEPLLATTPVKPYDGVMPEHGVDLELEPGGAPAQAQPSSIDFEPIHLDLPQDDRRGG